LSARLTRALPVRTLIAALLAAGGLSPAVAADSGDDPAPHVHAADAGESLALYGRYPMTREASGTSWQPDTTPEEGIQDMSGSWMTMLHGFVDVLDDDQAGPRGARQSVSTSMLMLMGRRQLPDAALGYHLMVSADPLMGPRGYPELFQTGETADGVHPLVDRQHPHNLLMEAAGSYSVELARDSAAFVYGGIAGEPALGPPAFMHRASGMEDPLAPLSHHWLDSTHVTYGVVTGGYVWDRAKIEASAFNGREPDQSRYRVELGRLDSRAVRLSGNPLPELSLQISTGRLASPEQLAPDVSVRRTTASLTYAREILGARAQTTLAWGRNAAQPGAASSAWLLESTAVVAQRHTIFGRAEVVGKDELFLPGRALYGQAFTVDALSLGYLYDFAGWGRLRLGAGAMVTGYRFASALDSTYGAAPVSYLLFVRARL